MTITTETEKKRGSSMRGAPSIRTETSAKVETPQQTRNRNYFP
jgi:hypothetical protein